MNFRTPRILIALLMTISIFSVGLHAQTDPTPISQAAAALAPEVKSDDLPAKCVTVGAGVKSGATSGFANVCGQVKGPVYACFAEDVTAGKTSTRAGIETIVWRSSGLFVSLKANAGVATGQTAVGGAYGVGGSLLYDLTKLKAPGYFAVASATYDYSNISDFANAAGAGVRHALGGGTYRLGIGKRF